MAGPDYTEQREPEPHEWAERPEDQRPEPFEASQHLSIVVQDKKVTFSTAKGESRADAARRFVQNSVVDLSGAGCDFRDAACVGDRLSRADGWAVERMPIDEWNPDGYDDPCSPRDCGVAFDRYWPQGGEGGFSHITFARFSSSFHSP